MSDSRGGHRDNSMEPVSITESYSEEFSHGGIFGYLKQHVNTLRAVLSSTSTGSSLIELLQSKDDSEGPVALNVLVEGDKPVSSPRRIGIYKSDVRRRSDLASELFNAIRVNDADKVRVALEKIAEYRYQLEYKRFEKVTARLDNLTIQSIVQRLNNEYEAPDLYRIHAIGDLDNSYVYPDQSGARKLPSAIYLELGSDAVYSRGKDDAEIQKEFSERIQKVLCAMPTDKPRTICVLGYHKKFPFNHFSSYIARVDENGDCEIYSLNSLPGYNDKLFIDAIEQGIKDASNKEHRKVAKQPLVIHQKDFSLCGFVSAVVLGSVNHNQTLASQFDHLEQVMHGAIRNKKSVRMLLARIAWWESTNSLPEVYLKDMSALFAQLLKHVCGLPTHENKIALSAENPALIAEYRRLLHAFNIEINDNIFLQMFEKIDRGEIENENARKSVDTIDYLNQIKKLVSTLPSTSGTKKKYNTILKNGNMTDSEKIKAIVELAGNRSATLSTQKSTLFRNIDEAKQIHKCLSEINLDKPCSESSFYKKSEDKIRQFLDRANRLSNNLREAGFLDDHPGNKKN